MFIDTKNSTLAPMNSSRFQPLPTVAIGALLLLNPVSSNAQSEAIVPKEKIDLLTPDMFESFAYHLNEKKSIKEKKEDIWILNDGLLHIDGRGYGYVRTTESYKNYHLVMDYKWGEKTWPPREDRTMDCGLLMHGHGDDGSVGDTWMASVEAQLIEGGSGDILVLQGHNANDELIKTRATAETRKDRDGEYVWKEGGEPVIFPEEGKVNQRINWKDRDPDWKDELGYRGEKDVENPVGEWNRMEVICDGDKIDILLNGVLVNQVYDVDPAEGFICLQSESAECWVGKLELWPLGGFKGGSKPEVKE